MLVKLSDNHIIESKNITSIKLREIESRFGLKPTWEVRIDLRVMVGPDQENYICFDFEEETVARELLDRLYKVSRSSEL